MSEEIYVIPNLRSPLLGVTAIEALQRSRRIERSSSRIPSPLERIGKDLFRVSKGLAPRNSAECSGFLVESQSC